MVENKRDVEQLKKFLKKCLCPTEKPLDAAHALAVISKTHDIRGGHRIWSIAQTHHLTVDRFTMWKFCILMHRILHEGHKQVLCDSLQYRGQLQKYAQYWSSQRSDEMGQCIAWYCQVLLRKLSFHQTYTHFNGNFQYEYEPSMDVNVDFQLCLDMCDYLEDLLFLQRVIFTNLTRHQISTDSKKGLCRLAALVTVITECNLLYQHSVAVLQLLHSQLSPDDISGLRVRFNSIFDELRIFFLHVRSEHLRLEFLEIPQLPACAPNLLPSASFGGGSSSSNGQHIYEPSAPLITDFED